MLVDREQQLFHRVTRIMRHISNVKLKAIVYPLLLLFASYLSSSPVAANFNLRVQTDLGAFDIELFDTIAPLSVANFMNYVNDADYDGTFFHRSIPGFVVQGGGYIFDGGVFFAGGVSHIPEDPPVINEFNLSNVRGTIAMAKLSDAPDSATSEWFFNLTDNSASLDNQNGGFTVFAQVLGDGIDILDEIASLTRCGDYLPPFVCGAFAETPTVDPNAVFQSNDVLVNISHIGFDNDGDGAIDDLEDAAPNGGDGNSDTILDSTQDNVASFPGAAGDNITVVVSPSASIESMDVLGATFALNASAASACVLNGLDFKHGYAGFTVSGVVAGGSIDVDIILPAGDTADTYFFNGPTAANPIPHWFEFAFNPGTGVGAKTSGNVVTLHLVDGGRGDADQTSNGVIVVAPGGPATITAPVDLDDDDCDGVLDSEEAGAPNKGDGNNDGVLDGLQGNVASLVDTISDTYVTVEVPSTVLVHTLFFTEREVGEKILIQASQSDKLAGLNFVHGFLNFSMGNTDPGGAVKVKLFLPENELPVRFFKFGPTPANPVGHLYEFDFNGETGAEINGNVITLHFVDGKRGDSDLVVNGAITDPGIPAIQAKNTGSDSGGGGGCSLHNKGARAEQAGAWWLMLGLACLHGIRRIHFSGSV